MEIENAVIAAQPYQLDVMDREMALKLLNCVARWDKELPLTKLRNLSLELQMHVFETWGMPYHTHRNGLCHITDLESIRLTLAQEASVELSVALLGQTSTVVMVIGNAVLVERSEEPGEVFLLTKEVWNG